jgi:hypothetical protein
MGMWLGRRRRWRLRSRVLFLARAVGVRRLGFPCDGFGGEEMIPRSPFGTVGIYVAVIIARRGCMILCTLCSGLAAIVSFVP